MDYELIFWVVTGIGSIIGFGVLWHFGKKEAENYVDLEDWK